MILVIFVLVDNTNSFDRLPKAKGLPATRTVWLVQTNLNVI
jgi:hypothetical protein